MDLISLFVNMARKKVWRVRVMREPFATLIARLVLQGMDCVFASDFRNPIASSFARLKGAKEPFSLIVQGLCLLD